MKRLSVHTIFCGIFLQLISLLFPVFSYAQQDSTIYKPHDIIEVGNGLKIEILNSRSATGTEEYEAIFFIQKRQQGIRKWIESNLLKNLSTLQNNATTDEAKSNEINRALLYRDSIVKAIGNIANKPVHIYKQPISATTKSDELKDTNKIPKITIAEPDISPKQLPPIINSKEIVTKPSNLKPNAYTLEECFKIALENNNGIRVAKNNIKSAGLDNKTAKYSLLPSLSYDVGHYFSFGKNIDPVTNAFSYETFSGGYTSLNLQLQLFSGFKKLNLIRQSVFQISAAGYEEQKAELELQTNIALTYSRILMANEELGIKRNNIGATQKELEAISEKIKVGRLTKYELYAFNGLLNTQQAELVALQNDSLAARQNLQQLLNIPFKQNIEIAPIDTFVLQEIFTSNISIEGLGEKQVATHPLVKKAEMNEQVAKINEKIAKGSLLPSLAIGGNVVSNYNNGQKDDNGGKIPLSTQLNNNLGQNINISLKIPIFTQLLNVNRIKKEKLNVANAQLVVEEAKNTIYSNTLQLVNDFNASKQKYIATKSAFEQNTLSFQLFNEKYKLGQINSVELIAAQDILNTATAKYLQSKIQLFFQYKVLELLDKTQKN